MQEALLRVHQVLDEGERIASRAFAATVTTRLAINELRSARARRERYVGEWLPEPIITDSSDDPTSRRRWPTMSLAMLVPPESLSPEQRAVLLLMTCSTMTIHKLLTGSARVRTTSASSPPAPDATSSSAAAVPNDQRAARRAGSPVLLLSTAISLGSRRCWLFGRAADRRRRRQGPGACADAERTKPRLARTLINWSARLPGVSLRPVEVKAGRERSISTHSSG